MQNDKPSEVRSAPTGNYNPAEAAAAAEMRVQQHWMLPLPPPGDLREQQPGSRAMTQAAPNPAAAATSAKGNGLGLQERQHGIQTQIPARQPAGPIAGTEVGNDGGALQEGQQQEQQQQGAANLLPEQTAQEPVAAAAGPEAGEGGAANPITAVAVGAAASTLRRTCSGNLRIALNTARVLGGQPAVLAAGALQRSSRASVAAATAAAAGGEHGGSAGGEDAAAGEVMMELDQQQLAPTVPDAMAAAAAEQSVHPPPQQQQQQQQQQWEQWQQWQPLPMAVGYAQHGWQQQYCHDMEVIMMALCRKFCSALFLP
jgi:hypothetical protein